MLYCCKTSCFQILRQQLQIQLFPIIRQLLQTQLLPSLRQLLQKEGNLPVVQNWGFVAISDVCVYGTKLTKGMLHMTTIAGMKARYKRYLQVEQQHGKRDAHLFRLC